jgi:hypothetical protein
MVEASQGGSELDFAGVPTYRDVSQHDSSNSRFNVIAAPRSTLSISVKVASACECPVGCLCRKRQNAQSEDY